MMVSPLSTPIVCKRAVFGQRVRWNAAFLTYRWAKRTHCRIEQQLSAVDMQRESVLQALARPARRMTQLHVIGAVDRLQPILEREF